MRADPPLANARTCSSVAIVVSPGNVVSSAPCAQPSLTASSGDSPVRSRRRSRTRSRRRRPRDRARPVRRWARELAAVHPGHRAPAVAIGGVHFAQRGRHDLDVRMLLDHPVDHPKERRRVELGLPATSGPGMPSPFCRSSSLPTSTSTCSTMRPITSTARLRPARNVPELLAEVQIEDTTAPAALAACMPSMMTSAVVSESAAKMPPLWNQRTPAREDGLPIEIAGLQQRARLVAAVVEDHRRAHPVAAIAVDRRHVRAVDAVVLEALVERPDAHGAHALGDQVADRIIDHGAGDAGLHPEAVRQIGGDIELAAADVDLALAGLAEGDDARIQTMHQRAE